MGVAARAILLPLDALGVQALVLVGEVIAVFAGLASENDFFAGHCSILLSQLRTVKCEPTISPSCELITRYEPTASCELTALSFEVSSQLFAVLLQDLRYY